LDVGARFFFAFLRAAFFFAAATAEGAAPAAAAAGTPSSNPGMAGLVVDARPAMPQARARPTAIKPFLADRLPPAPASPVVLVISLVTKTPTPSGRSGALRHRDALLIKKVPDFSAAGPLTFGGILAAFGQ
jgi:hypothetical protein